MKDKRGGINDDEESSKDGFLEDGPLERAKDGWLQGAVQISHNLWDV